MEVDNCWILDILNINIIMKRGFAALTLVGVAAAIAVFALTQNLNFSLKMNL